MTTTNSNDIAAEHHNRILSTPTPGSYRHVGYDADSDLHTYRTTEDNMTTYSIRHSHGVTERGFETYEAAVAAVLSVYSHAAIGHSGDISDGGERTLCWVDEETAHNADGSRACAVITANHAG